MRYSGFSWKCFVLKEKLKLKEWHKEVYGNLSFGIRTVVDELDDVEVRLCEEQPVDCDQRKLLSSEFWRCA